MRSPRVWGLLICAIAVGGCGEGAKGVDGASDARAEQDAPAPVEDMLVAPDQAFDTSAELGLPPDGSPDRGGDLFNVDRAVDQAPVGPVPQLAELEQLSDRGGMAELLVPRSAISAAEVAVLVNTRDPQSVAVADHYMSQRGIPAQNRVEISFSIADSINRTTFAPLKDAVDLALASRSDIQALAISWTRPWKVEGMSITSALTLGFDEKYFNTTTNACSTTAAITYQQKSTRPFTDNNLRLSMMLAAASVDEGKKLIDKAVSADATFPTGHGYLIRTSNNARSQPRQLALRICKEAWDRPGGIAMTYVDNTGGAAADDVFRNKTDVFFYFTGLAQVPEIDTNTFVPGAVADHLTSSGGRLFDGTQTSILRWLEAGAAASQGTVREPCAYAQKFSDPRRLIHHYFAGATVVEAYWKSVKWPGEGLFVGDPLTRPFGSRIAVVGSTVEITTTALDPARKWALYGGASTTDNFTKLRDLDVPEGPERRTITVPNDHAIYWLRPSGLSVAPVALASPAELSGHRVVTYESTERAVVVRDRYAGTRRLKIGATGLPAISGDLLVWAEPKAVATHDLLTRETRRHATTALPRSPRAWGTRVVWSENRTTGQEDIFLFDFASGIETRLTDNVARQSDARIHGDHVVWQDLRHGDASIYHYDLQSGQERRISTPPSGIGDTFPQIWGDIVVFKRWSTGLDGDQHVMMYDLSTDTTERVSPGHDFQNLPMVADGRLAFTDARYGAFNVYVMDLATKTTRRLSYGLGTDQFVKLGDGLISWTAIEGEAPALLVEEQRPGNQPPKLVPIVDRWVFEVGQRLMVHLRGSDQEGGPLIYSATLPSGAALTTVGGALRTGLWGDVDESGAVDGVDVALVNAALGRRRGESGYDPRADLDDDDDVDAVDLAVVQRYSAGEPAPQVGLFDWTVPALVVDGTLPFTFGVEDDAGQRTAGGTLYSWNTSPTFVDLADLTASVGDEVSFYVRATDVEDSVEDYRAQLGDGRPVDAIGASFEEVLAGDLDGDGAANIVEYSLIKSLEGTQRGDASFDPMADFNNDGLIDAADLTIFLTFFGRQAQVGLFRWTVPASASGSQVDVVFSVGDGVTARTAKRIAISVQ